jgi:hypothetical protein
MSSKKLSLAADLAAYTEHQAYIRIFQYRPLNQYDHLVCVHGDRGQGTSGEVAHLKIAKSAYEAIAKRYPIAERESHLFRSDFFVVADVYALVQQGESAPVMNAE